MRQIGEEGGAEDLLREGLTLDTTNARYAYILGIALNSIGTKSEAVQVLQDAHDHFGGDFDIAMALAQRHPEDQNVVALLSSLNAIESPTPLRLLHFSGSIEPWAASTC